MILLYSRIFLIGESQTVRFKHPRQHVYIEKGQFFYDSYGEVAVINGIGVQFEETKVLFSGWGGVEFLEISLKADSKELEVEEVIKKEREFRDFRYYHLEEKLVIIVEDYHENGIEIVISPGGEIEINNHPHE